MEKPKKDENAGLKIFLIALGVLLAVTAVGLGVNYLVDSNQHGSAVADVWMEGEERSFFVGGEQYTLLLHVGDANVNFAAEFELMNEATGSVTQDGNTSIGARYRVAIAILEPDGSTLKVQIACYTRDDGYVEVVSCPAFNLQPEVNPAEWITLEDFEARD